MQPGTCLLQGVSLFPTCSSFTPHVTGPALCCCAFCLLTGIVDCMFSRNGPSGFSSGSAFSLRGHRLPSPQTGGAAPSCDLVSWGPGRAGARVLRLGNRRGCAFLRLRQDQTTPYPASPEAERALLRGPSRWCAQEKTLTNMLSCKFRAAASPAHLHWSRHSVVWEVAPGPSPPSRIPKSWEQKARSLSACLLL